MQLETISQTADKNGWHARLEMGFALGNDATVLCKNSHTGPLRLQRPFYPEPDVCHAYILHPPGGVVGGDRLEVHADVHSGASALVTTPGATKFYRSHDRMAMQTNVLHVQAKGSLEWLPQETIVYPGANAVTATRINLESGAGLIGWEIVCIGLPACGQPFTSGSLTTAMEIHRNDRPIFKDRLRIMGKDDLARSTGMRNHSVVATLMATGCNQEMLTPLRHIMETPPEGLAGITLMEDLLLVRYLGNASSEAKTLFQRLWSWLRPHLSGREACPPRIWST